MAKERYVIGKDFNTKDWFVYDNKTDSYICRDTENKCKQFVENLINGGTVMNIGVITRQMAQEFYRDLCGTVYGDANKNSQGIMSVGLIADRMKIPFEKAEEFCDAMIKYDITERTMGMVIV